MPVEALLLLDADITCDRARPYDAPGLGDTDLGDPDLYVRHSSPLSGRRATAQCMRCLWIAKALAASFLALTLDLLLANVAAALLSLGP